MVEEKSYEDITKNDLKALHEKVLETEIKFFDEHQRYFDYKNKLVGIALCQGAAKHYLDNNGGVKDFDVWLFYSKIPNKSMYRRKVKSVDCGLPKFGKDPKGKFENKRLDIIARVIETGNLHDPKMILRKYLQSTKTESAKKLSEKAVIGIYPDEILGEKIWPY